MQSKFSIEAIEFQIASEVRCDEQGKGFYTYRAVSRICGLSPATLPENLISSRSPKIPKLSQYLVNHGFEVDRFEGWKTNGIPDTAVATIAEYYAMEAGARCTDEARAFCKVMMRIGVRAYTHKLTGWKPENSNHHQDIEQYKAALLQAVLEEQIPEKATTWQCRYPKDFWEALEDLYGLKQGHRGCAAFINNYIYGYFPAEVQNRLDEINPLLDSGARANRQHQHFDDVLLEVLQNHIGKVIFLLKASADRKAFRKSMQKIKKIKFNLSNMQYLKGV